MFATCYSAGCTGYQVLTFTMGGRDDEEVAAAGAELRQSGVSKLSLSAPADFEMADLKRATFVEAKSATEHGVALYDNEQALHDAVLAFVRKYGG